MFKKKKVVAIVQARYKSTRLPGKVMKYLAGRTCLQQVVSRLNISDVINSVIIALPDNETNYPLHQHIKQDIKCPVYLGSENDVLNRVTQAALYTNADVIVDITADCPLVAPEIIDTAYDLFSMKHLDYIANVSSPPLFNWPNGLDFQIYTITILKQLNYLVPPGPHRSHTGWNIFPHIKLINTSLGRQIRRQYFSIEDIAIYKGDCALFNKGAWQLTLDEEDDLILLSEIFWHFRKIKRKEYFTYRELCEFLTEKPDLRKINSDVIRKIPGNG